MARFIYILIFSQFFGLITVAAQSHLINEVVLFEGGTDIATTPTFEISPLDGSVLVVNSTGIRDNVRVAELYNEDLLLITSKNDTSSVDGTLTELTKDSSLGHVGVTSHLTFQNSFNWFEIFSFGAAGATSFFDSSDVEESLTATHIHAVDNATLITAGNAYGYFTTTPDSVFVGQFKDHHLTWSVREPGSHVLALDRSNEFIQLTIALTNRLNVHSYNKGTGIMENSYSIDISDYRFMPLVYRFPETNDTLVAKATDTYEVSCFDVNGFKWGYHKLQTAETTSIDRIGDIQFDEEGNVYLTGIFYTQETGSGVLVSKLSPDGDLKWERRYDNAPNLKTWSSHSIINGDILYVSGQETTESGSWSQFLVAYSLDDGQLLKESKTPENGEYRFSTKALKVCDDQVLALGTVNGPDREEFVLRKFDFPTTPTSTDDLSSVRINDGKLVVYPNPAERMSASVKLTEQHGISYLEIVSISGLVTDKLRVVPGQREVRIPIVKPGAYLVVAYNQDHQPLARERVIIR